MAWFVVQKKGERAQVVPAGELMGAVYRARTDVRAVGFATYEKAQADADVADTKLGIRRRKADVKRTAGALEVAVQAHKAAPTKQTLDAALTASAAHEAECTELRILNKTLRALVRK